MTVKLSSWPVWVWWGIGFLGYGSLAWRISLWAHWGQLWGLYHFTPTLGLGLAYVGLVGLLYGCYLQIACFLKDERWRPKAYHLFGYSVLLALPTILVYPFNANDIFRYALRGRISAIYQANPYTQPPSSFPTDFFTPLAGEWVSATTPYGPVWEIVAAGIAFIGRASPYYHILSLKLFSLVAFWGIGWLIWRGMAHKSVSQQLYYAFLWWGNPALLLTFGIDGHNDSLMLFWLVWGWLVWRNGRNQANSRLLWLGLLIMWFGPLTKAIAILPIPFFMIASWSALDSWKQRIWLTLNTAVSYLLVAVLLFHPFGSVVTFAGRLVSEATGGASFSLPALIILAVRALEIPFRFTWLSPVALTILALVALWLSWRGWWHKRLPTRNAADLFFAYILQAFNFRLWYTTWLFPFLLLDGATSDDNDPQHEYRLFVGLWFLLCGQLVVFVYSHLWHSVGRNSLWSHLIGVPFTFAMPFLLARWLPIPSVTQTESDT